MPFNVKNSSVTECFSVIEQFITHTKTKGLNKESSLNEVILYFADLKHPEMFLMNERGGPITILKAICDSNDAIMRANFLIALTSICADYSPLRTISDLHTEDYSPTDIIAAFHNESLKCRNKPIVYEVKLNQLAQASYTQQAVMLFCIKTFVPDLVISGEFMQSENELSMLSDIINNNTIATGYTYKNKALNIKGPTEMAVFLHSVSKANRLVLQEVRFDLWSTSDFIYFVNAVKSNPQLTSLSLAYTHLGTCCENPKKFKYLLELIHLPHLTELNLHHNRLGTLPKDKLKQLEDAVLNAQNKHKLIGLQMKHEKKGTASDTGLFASCIMSANNASVSKHTDSNPQP